MEECLADVSSSSSRSRSGDTARATYQLIASEGHVENEIECIMS